MAMSSFPPGCDIAPALTPYRQTTHRHLATVALETPYRCSTVASFPTVQVREEPTHDVIRKRSKLSELLLADSAEDGSWGAWSPFRPCSVSCGEGLQLSERKCDSPAPRYGGKVCEGPSTQSKICESPCPGNTHTDKHLEPWTATHSVTLLLKASLLRLVHASWTSEQDPCLLML